MIKNKHQLQITQIQRDKFAQALEHFLNSKGDQLNIHPLLQKAQEEALRSLLTELDEEIENSNKLIHKTKL